MLVSVGFRLERLSLTLVLPRNGILFEIWQGLSNLFPVFALIIDTWFFLILGLIHLAKIRICEASPTRVAGCAEA